MESNNNNEGCDHVDDVRDGRFRVWESWDALQTKRIYCFPFVKDWNITHSGRGEPGRRRERKKQKCQILSIACHHGCGPFWYQVWTKSRSLINTSAETPIFGHNYIFGNLCEFCHQQLCSGTWRNKWNHGKLIFSNSAAYLTSLSVNHDSVDGEVDQRYIYEYISGTLSRGL